MTILDIVIVALGCLVTGQPKDVCMRIGDTEQQESRVAGAQPATNPRLPVRTGQAIDVDLTAQSVLAWDEETGMILYEKNASEVRPIASLSKLLSALVVRSVLSPTALVEVPPQVRQAQRRGANVKLPVGEHVSVADLLAAGLTASANDALVTLAMATYGSEEAFVSRANTFAQQHGFLNTRVSNATGLMGGEQYSTAYDVKEIFRAVYRDSLLGSYLNSPRGVLRTQEGTTLGYQSTNKLIGTYLPILAGKTGYTSEAGQNLALMTEGEQGQRIGIIVLGSKARFQDAKVLVEWVRRNYRWE